MSPEQFEFEHYCHYLEDPHSDDIYSDVDLKSLPDWWEKNIREFDQFGFRSYRPSIFEDGTLVPSVIWELERKTGLDITIIGKNIQQDDPWKVYVNDTEAGSIKRYRNQERYTIFRMGSAEFVDLVYRVTEQSN